MAPGDITAVLHGTTVGSNAILQKRGGRVGLLTTRGFRDVLEIGRLRTPGMFDLTWDKPKPLVPRNLRLRGARADRRRRKHCGSAGGGRTGDALPTLRRRRSRDAGDLLPQFLLQSRPRTARCRNHPRCVAVTCPSRRRFPSCPKQREYERTSTTVVNAYVLPVMRELPHRLQDGLRRAGVTAPLFISNSNGGLRSRACRAGKAGNVHFLRARGRASRARGHMGRLSGIANLVAFDMGGTTASASLIKDGELARTTEYEFRDGISTPQPLHQGRRLPDAGADRGRRRDRQRRRLHRPGRRGRPDLGRPALRRRQRPDRPVMVPAATDRR